MKTKSIYTVILSAVLALAMFAAVLPQPAQAASDTPTVACAQKYTVKKDQTPNKIAKLFGLRWAVIAKANHLSVSSIPAAGDELCIPFKKGAAPVTGTVVVTAKGNKVSIDVKKFSHGEVFFVKVKDATAKVPTWYKLTSLSVAKNEVKTVNFTLPSDLDGVTKLSVCLKNVYTDDLTCYVVNRLS